MSGQPYLRRLNELEQRFEALTDRLPDSAEKEALSILHGMVQETWRQLAPSVPGAGSRREEPTFEDIANLYRRAPSMGGQAVSTPLPVGAVAPDFSLPDANGERLSLTSFRGRPVVLVFYPLDWSPTCSDQLSLYQAELDEFRRFGAQLIGVSVDSIYSHGAWAAVRGLEFPLVADFEPKGAVGKAYGIYREADGFSERALFVIGPDGIIRYAHVSPQLDHIPDIYELFAVLAGLTGRDAPSSRAETGEPGERTLAGVGT